MSGTERISLPFGCLRTPLTKFCRTKTVRLTKSTSRQRSASNSPIRRPVKAATTISTEYISASSSVRSAPALAATANTSSEVRTLKSPDRSTVTRSASSAGVDVDPAFAFGSLEDAVVEDENLLDGAPAQLPFFEQLLPHGVDALRRYVGKEGVGAEVRDQQLLGRRPVVPHRPG